MAIVLLILSIFFIGCESDSEEQKVQPVSKAIIAVNSLGKTLSIVNLETEEIQNNIVGVGLSPNQVVLKDSLVLVINSQSNDLTAFYFNSNDSLILLGTFPLAEEAENKNPWMLEVTDDSTFYVSNWLDNSVSKVNLNDFSVKKVIPVGAFPQSVRKVGNKLLVGNTNYPNSGSISVLNLATDLVEKTIKIGFNPQDIEITPNGKIHVVCTGNYSDIEGKIFVLDENTFEVTDSLEVGGQPADLEIVNEIGYLASGGFEVLGFASGIVFSYNTETLELLRGLENPIRTDFGATRIVSDSKGKIYISCFDDDSVNILEADSVTKKYVLGDGTQGIAIRE
ncbi:MAG: hypothetical protein DWQ06_10830 [Calditrichaeota bacterium]|nr:MAG: hypothetical protein DWQ06_10830 [Calditrichota bacterium]